MCATSVVLLQAGVQQLLGRVVTTRLTIACMRRAMVVMTGVVAGGGLDGSLGHSCWSCPTDRPPAPSGPTSGKVVAISS